MEAKARKPTSLLRPDLAGLPRLADRLLVRSLALASAPWIDRVEGASLADLPDPAIFALSHNNTFECLAVPPWLFCERAGRPLHFVIDWMYLEIPVIGRLIRRFEPIAVYTKPARFRLFEEHRQEHRRRSPIERALACLTSGRSVALFPEGRRNHDARSLLRGRPGLGPLVLGSDAAVVPIGIDFPARERLGRVPRLGRVCLRIGEPLAFEAERAAARSLAGDSAAASRLGRCVVDRVMTSLATLSGKAKARSTSSRASSLGRIYEATRDLDDEDHTADGSRRGHGRDLGGLPA